MVMDIWIGFAVAVLKAGVSGALGKGIVQALADQGINIGSDKLRRYLEKSQKELSQILTDKSLLDMKVPKEYIAYVKEEIRELIQSISLDEDLFRECRYDANSLAEALYEKYKGQKKDFVEYESKIQKVLYVMSEKAILSEKGRDGFTADILTDILNNQEEQMELIRKVWSILDESMKNRTTYLENEQKQEQNKRLPDRTEEYYRKWNENMFLNDFDEDDENAGVNIPLYKMYQMPFYRLKDQEKDLSNLGERLDRCTQGQDPKNRMLLILGQPGMGKSTMITWFLQRYQKKQDADKKEILVYRFTDLNVEGSFNSIGVGKKEKRIGDAILKCLNMEKQDLNGKILVLDGFDEVAFSNNRTEILNCLYNTWARDTGIEDFSLLITCRENYINNLSRLLFPYITLQPWNDDQIDIFCRKYEEQAKSQISEEAIDKLKNMRNIFGIPILLYMSLALGITVGDESSVVEVYDQIFSLEGGIYDRCVKKDASVRWDDQHRIAEIKKQIHQFSREISMWMFGNNSEKATIQKNEYEKIRDEIFKNDDWVGESQKKDVLIGNYFSIIYYYNEIDPEELTFVHRSIYEYFVAETICSEIRQAAIEMTEKSQEKLARVLGYRLKQGKIDYTISQYLKAKMIAMITTYSEKKKNQFYIWLEGTVEKMLDAGVLCYTGKNNKGYSNVIEKEVNCFANLLAVLRQCVVFSNQKYILQNVNRKQMLFYVRCLISFANVNEEYIHLCYTYLLGADLKGADLVGAWFRRANLRRAFLEKADLSIAILLGTDLAEANLKKATLLGTNLSEANLTKANLIEADLTKAILTGANLSEANLGGADLCGANLHGADLKNAYINQTFWVQEDVEQYIDLFKQAEFKMINLYSKKTGKRTVLTQEDFIARYPD